MGLGVMLKPLREFSIDPSRVPEMIFCTLPITITMVIPIAALMATTLVYGRLAFENEITACRSSGIGLPTLVYPALMLALLVGVITLLLSFHVNPVFISRLERIFTNDAEAIIYNNIEKKGNLGKMFPKIMIHADKVYPEQHTLKGAVIIFKNKRKIERIVTADTITIKMPQPGDINNEVTLHLTNTRAIGVSKTDDTSQENRGYVTFAITMPSFLPDKIKFKKLNDLKMIRSDMSHFGEIKDHFEKMKNQLTAELFFQWCDQELRSNRSVTLNTDNRRFVLYADKCKQRTYEKVKLSKLKNKEAVAYISPNSKKTLYLQEYRPDNNTPINKYLAIPRKNQQVIAELNFEANSPPTAILSLENVENSFINSTHSSANASGPTRREKYSVRSIKIPQQIIDKVNQIPFNAFIEDDNTPPLANHKPSRVLTALASRLKEECLLLNSEISAELHSRLAFGISCVILTLMGAALGIIFRSGHLLTAFGVSIGPAAFCLITIFTGQHIAENHTSGFNSGLIFLWSGIATVALGNFIMYRKLTKL